MGLHLGEFLGIKNVNMIIYGKGDILTMVAGNNEIQILMMKQIDPGKIGRKGDNKPKTIKEFNPDIAIIFENEQSFQVFEQKIKEIRKQFNKQKPKP
jgi:hypothetical protein